MGEENPRLGYKIYLKVKKILCKETSDFNPLIYVIETENFGKVLLLGTEKELTIQYSEEWDFYDEMLAHVPMCAHGSPKNVLIIGGGDGGVLKEVLKYPTVEKVDLVEIDEKVVQVSKKYLRHGYVFDNEKVNIHYKDGAEFLEKTNNTYDVIIGDYTDPYEGLPASTLTTEAFYKNLYKRLEDNGITTIQSGSPILQKEIFQKIYKNATKVFNKTNVYVVPVPIYPGGLWTFLALSKKLDSKKPNCVPPETRYYTIRIHEASFILPKFVEELISKNFN